MRASSSDTFSSALSYALELLGMPNLTLKKEQRKSLEAVYQGNSVFVWVPTGFGKSNCCEALPFVIECKKGQRGSNTMLLLAMTTCFMSSQFCRVGGGLWFLFDSYALLLYRKLLLVITRQYLRRFCGYGAMRVWNWRAFVIRLIPGSPPPSACRLGEPGNEAP